MSCQSALKFGIYTSAGLIIFLGLVMEIAFIILACGHFAEATDSKGLLIAVGTVFFIVMIILALIGFYGVWNKNIILLIIYAAIAGLVFFCFWIAFAYMKKGQGKIVINIR